MLSNLIHKLFNCRNCVYVSHAQQIGISMFKDASLLPIIKSNKKTGQRTSLHNLGYETELIRVDILFSDWENEVKFRGLA